MEAYDFYHASDARRQGVGTLIFVHLFVLAFCGILYFFHIQFGMPFEGGFRNGMVGVIALVYLGFLVYALILIVAGGQWIFAVRDGVLCVKSPAKCVGETFTILVADIVSITQVRGRKRTLLHALYVVSKTAKAPDHAEFPP